MMPPGPIQPEELDSIMTDPGFWIIAGIVVIISFISNTVNDRKKRRC